MRRLVALGLLVLLSGCYGRGTLGWGSNGTQFEVMREDGYIEVTVVGKGAMKAVPSGASPEYTGEGTRWDEFGLQFQEAGTHIAFNRSPTASSPELSAGKPFPLSSVATGNAELGQRLYFCVEEDPDVERRFGVIIREGFGGYNLWFESVPLCA